MNGAPSEGLCITEQRPSTCRMVQPAAGRRRRTAKPAREAAEQERDGATRKFRDMGSYA
jgi:hypothetical protein